MLTPAEYCLINGQSLEAVPARLYRAKSNAHARFLAQADWLIRDKSTGKFLATYSNYRVHFFQRLYTRIAVQDGISALLEAQQHTGLLRPLSDAKQLARSLGIDTELYALKHQLELMAEPYVLEYAGKDRYQRPLWLEQNTKNAWLGMQNAARKDHIQIDAISGYRSCHYQMGIFNRKLARGQTIEQILKVNAAPGFSEHHSGRALDIGTRGQPAAEESFENTDAFKWLNQFAGDFSFKLSYSRNNIHGINYEPWHWCWQAKD
jgi:D-alanyl-D-alanine carboxypeptidase